MAVDDDDRKSDEHERGLLALTYEWLRFLTPPVAKARVNGVNSGAVRLVVVAGKLRHPIFI